MFLKYWAKLLNLMGYFLLKMLQTALHGKISPPSLEQRLQGINDLTVIHLQAEVHDKLGKERINDLLKVEILSLYLLQNPSLYKELISDAIDISLYAHEGHKRGSGIPYIAHLFQVGYILSFMGMGSSVIAAGLNHDAIEKNLAKRAEITYLIKNRLGIEVLGIVMQVTRIGAEETNFAIYEPSLVDWLRKMMAKGAEPNPSTDAINVADGVSNLLTLDGLKSGTGEISSDGRFKSLLNSIRYVLPAAARIDEAYGGKMPFNFYPFVSELIVRGFRSLQPRFVK